MKAGGVAYSVASVAPLHDEPGTGTAEPGRAPAADAPEEGWPAVRAGGTEGGGGGQRVTY